MTDEELMVAYAQGDLGAGRRIFARHVELILRVVRRHIWNDADVEDLAQQTFLHLHRARGDYKPAMRFRPWLLTIAMNLTRDLQRRRFRHLEQHLEDTFFAATPEELREDVAPRVRAAVRALPEDQRQAIELHWFEHRSFDDIAAKVGLSAGALRVRAHRGYVALRRALA